MENNMEGEKWCNICSKMVHPITEAVNKCPFCDTQFVAAIHMSESSNNLRMTSEQDVDVEVERATETENANQNENGLVIVNNRRPSSQMMNIFRALNIRMVSEDDDESENSNFYILDNNDYNEGAMILRNPNTTTTTPPTTNISELFNNEYGVGSNFDLLLQHLIHMGTSSYANGPNPPAKWDAVEALPIVINEEIFLCTICLEEVEIGNEVKEMPCEHKFHGGCIVAWLKLHCSCPVCRFKLPYTRARILTQYERNRNNQNNNRVREEERNGNGNGNGNGSGNGRRNWFPVLQQSDNFSP